MSLLNNFYILNISVQTVPKRIFPLGYCSYEKKQPPEVFCKKGVFKSFANFTGKHFDWSLFLIKLQALCLQIY